MLRLLLTCALLFAATPAAAREPTAAEARARDLGLAADPTWGALLHRPPASPRRLLYGAASEVPQGPFFLAPTGRTDPEAELLATLRALEEPAEGDEAVRCRFPARTRWLGERLDLPEELVDLRRCPALASWRDDLGTVGVTMVLPEAFMNNPASMFGHTLLRLDVAGANQAQNLLGFAVDFTASTGDDKGIVFFARGMLGRYPGRFGVNPYYQTLEVYADYENRDVWEYPLALSPEQVEFLVLHIWEMEEVTIPYYFFRQNCSYQLIRLLAVVEPELDMRHGFPVGTMPVDTVRDVIDQIGLAEEPRYRPSPAKVLGVALRDLSPSSRALALSLAHGEITPDELGALPDRERASVLSAAYDALRYVFTQSEIAPEEARRRSYQLLLARSRAGAIGGDVPPVPATRPDEGHGTGLLAVGGGVQDGEAFVELRARSTFHGPLDPEAGLPDDSTLGLVDARLRVHPRTGRVRLEELVLTEVASKTPRDDIFRHWSWSMETGLRTRLFPDEDGGDLDRGPVWRTGVGAGLSFLPADGPLLLYGFGHLWLEAGPGFDRWWAAGPGIELGLELSPGAGRWKGRAFGRATRFVVGDRESAFELGLGQRITLTRNTALLGEASLHRFAHESWIDARLSVQWTF